MDEAYRENTLEEKLLAEVEEHGLEVPAKDGVPYQALLTVELADAVFAYEEESDSDD